MDVTLLWIALIYLLDGVSTAQKNLTEVQVGDSITLFTDENRTDEKLAYIKWTVNHKKIITYIAEGGERRAKAYADRIELDHYTGDLKLKNLQQSDSGDYRVVHIRSAKEFARMKKDIVKKLLTMDIRDYAYNIRITDNVANGTEINVNLHGDFDDDNPLLALF